METLLNHEHTWSIADIGQNAISGILNDPNGMDSLPPIPQSAIKKIRTSDLGEVFDKYHYNRAIGLAVATEGTPTLAGVEQVEKDSFDVLVDLTSKRKIQLGGTRKPRMLSTNAPPLETVPKLFFASDFTLESPLIFSELTSDDAFLTCGLLQDKLALFLDAVEVHLMREISRRSSSFFSALHTLQNLNGETQVCVAEIRALREKMAQISHTHMGQSLEVSRLHSRRENYFRLHKTIKSVYTIEEKCFSIYRSVEDGNLQLALDHIEDAILNLKGLSLNPNAGVEDSSGAKTTRYILFCMLHYGGQLRKNPPHGCPRQKPCSTCTWPFRIDKMVDVFQSYRDALVKELKMISKTGQESFSRYYPSVVFIPDEASVPGADGAKKKDQQNILAKQLRTMTFDSFFELITRVFVALLHIMQRASTKKTNIDEDDDELGSIEMAPDPIGVNDNAGAGEFFSTEQSTLSQLLQESSEVLLAISDVANNRCAKLISVRADQNKQLNPIYFYKLYSASMEFIQGSEKICGRLCFGLKGALMSQAKAFLTHFHDERSRQIAVLVENDQWARAEVPSDFQNIITQIVKSADPSSAATPDVDSRRDSEDVHEDEPHDDDGDIASANIPPVASPMKTEDKHEKTEKQEVAKSSRHLVIGSQKFNVAGCVLLLLKMITEYIQCLEHIPTISTEVLNRLIELLKLFNSKTCQVILGAGATKSAGLKNINAGHIALAAQSLGLVVALIPYVKQVVEKYLPVKQQILTSDFDRIAKDYSEHQSELFAKLISIMHERLCVQCELLIGINWDKPEPKDVVPDDPASTPMSQLVKETVTLHRVLSKYLDVDTLRKIVGNVFRLYNNKMEEEFKNIELFTSAGKNRLLIDVQFFISQLSALDNVDGPGNHLEVVVNNIKIKDRRRTVKK
ncbi:Vps54-like protein-domain-containing protein [Chytridium lagenaria]|nr:Vps54-like protein-domain-containing protein [Chytridium lagenaria]